MAEPTGSKETDPRTEADLAHLRRCVDLVTEAVDAGDEPFGSVLVAATGEVLAEDRNRVGAGDPTRHPGSPWRGGRRPTSGLPSVRRRPCTRPGSTVRCVPRRTGGSVSGGSCTPPPRCSWRAGSPSSGLAPSPVGALPIREIAPHVVVDGPEPTLAAQVHALHARFHAARPAGG